MTRAVQRRGRSVGGDDETLQSLKAKRALERDGLYLPSKPDDERPSLPKDLTDLDDKALMTLFSSLTAWVNYTAGQMSAAEVDERYADAVLDRVKALVQLQAVAGGAKVTDAQKEAHNHPDVVEAFDAHFALHAKRKLTAAISAAAERDQTMCSRELTRRLGRNDTDRRDSRWSSG